MAEALAFTAAEVAFVLREPIRVVKKALDEGPVEPRLVAKGGNSVRAIEWSDLLYLFAVQTLRSELTRKARNEFYHALKKSPERMREIRFGRLSVAISDFEAEVAARARELAALADKVEFRTDGEAVLKGTGAEIYRIAALIGGGLSVEDIRQDYPSLSAAQIADAQAYAEAHPKPGRPFAATTFKRAMQGAGLDALDEVLDD